MARIDRFLGRIGFAVLGGFLGPLGAVFGLLIGWMVDLLIARLRSVPAGSDEQALPSGGRRERTIVAARLLAAIDRYAPARPGESMAAAIARDCRLSERRLRRVLAREFQSGGPGVHPASLRDDLDELPSESRALLLNAFFDECTDENAERLLAALCATLSPPFVFGWDAQACALLGVQRDTPFEEVRTVYRRLAADFHPDAVIVLSARHRRMSAHAFSRIADSFRRVERRRHLRATVAPSGS